MNKKQLTRCAGVWVATVLMASVAIAAPKKELSKLTPEGQKALAEYTGMLESLRADLKGKIPVIDEQKAQDFMAAHKKKGMPLRRSKTIREKSLMPSLRPRR
jgi:DNA replication initiation complex subunit (GINS family)